MAQNEITAEEKIEQQKEVIEKQNAALKKEVVGNKRARRSTKRKSFVIILLVFLLIIALLSGAAYAIMQFAEDNNFRISVTQTGTDWLSLSKNLEFTNPTSVLDASAPKNFDNCSLCNYLDYKIEDICAADGSFNGEGHDTYYIATTFYLKNSGKKDVKYKEMITISRATKKMEKALRVMVIKDENPYDDDLGVVTVYAAPQCDATGKTLLDGDGNPILERVVPLPDKGGMPQKYTPASLHVSDPSKIHYDVNDVIDGDWYAKPFEGNGYVMNSELYPMVPGQIIKYSVIIWLEGWDNECVDEILGGQVKLGVEFETGH